MTYRFSSAAQWNACQFERADRAFAGLRPFAPYATPPALFETRGAHAPAITPAGQILWRDDAGVLYRLPLCADAPEQTPEPSPAPAPIARAARMIATPRGLWVASGRTVFLYEEHTLSRLLAVELDGPIDDIAADGHGGIFALVGNVVVAPGRASIELQGIGPSPGRKAFVFLRRAGRFVALAGERLHWFAAQGGALFSIRIAAMRPCFAAHALGSDSESRVFVAGADGPSFGGGAHVLSFDADGKRLSDVALDEAATGVVAARDSLLVAGRRGLSRFITTATVPDATGEVRCAVTTPLLQAPDREDGRRWLRIEASSTLPRGATIEISLAATDDPEAREPELRRPPAIVFHGSETAAAPFVAAPFVAPLFDVRERYLRVSIALSAAPGARLPELTGLAVLYPGRTLMENLPAIYQRAEGQPGSFLRALVGVLETTTQDLDARIAAMGSHIHPSTAPEEWLDFVARWLGLPWDDGLSVEQKRAIVRRAPEIARGRGTRAGLEALLDSLIPGTPRRFRVTDATADFGFATLGGSALPALLGGGFRGPSAELGERSILGLLRLPCAAGPIDESPPHLDGRIRVEIAAMVGERKAWEPWLLALITEMVPLTARVELRFVRAGALRGDRLDGTLTLEGPSAPHLGTGAVTGLALLPERGARLSASGPDIGTTLR